MQSVKKRWFHLAVACIMMLCLGAMYSWSIFRQPILAIFPSWTAAELSLNFTLTMSCFVIGTFLGGKLMERISHRHAVLLGALFLFVGFFGSSHLPQAHPTLSLVMLYVFYGVFNGLGTGISYNAVVSTIPRWFPDKGGLVSGILLSCVGFGSLLIGQGSAWLVGAMGLSLTFRMLAIIIASILTVGSFYITAPSDKLDFPPATQSKATASQYDFTPTQMLGTPAFWINFVWNTCLGAAGLMVINSAATIASYFGAVASLGLLVSVFNGSFRSIYGILLDKYGRVPVMYLNTFAATIAGLILLGGSVLHSTVLVFCGMMLVGICYGGQITLNLSNARQLFGAKYFSVNFGLSNFSTIPASLIGPFISGVLQDMSGGSFTTTFAMLIFISLVALVALFFLKQPVPSKN